MRLTCCWRSSFSGQGDTVSFESTYFLAFLWMDWRAGKAARQFNK
jgi:hypothetical protein